MPLHLGALVEKTSPLYSSFELYKNDLGSSGDEHRDVVAAILSGGYDQHGDAIAAELGGAPTIVTTVPSTRPTRPIHPLQGVIQRVAAVCELAGDTLELAGAIREPHRYQPGLFRATTDVSDERVLLVEDLWVRGTTVDSAAMTLGDAGARVVVLSIGRLMRREFGTCGELLESLGKPAWW